MGDTSQVPQLLQCPLCAPIERVPMWWLCQRVSKRDGVNTYALVLNCPHISDVMEFEFPPKGFGTDRAAMAKVWNDWCESNQKQPVKPVTT